MIAEVCYQGSPPRIETRVFPGASLPFGFHRFIDKVMSLIWVIFLVAGPREETMRYFLSKVRSVTTDMGLEVNIAAAPDLLPPLLRWMAGEPLTDLYNTVDPLSRLFPRAIRIGGISHILGSIMKTAAYSYRQWPQYIEWIRALVKWFRSEEHRTHLLWVLGDHFKNTLSGFLLI